MPIWSVGPLNDLLVYATMFLRGPRVGMKLAVWKALDSKVLTRL